MLIAILSHSDVLYFEGVCNLSLVYLALGFYDHYVFNHVCDDGHSKPN